MDLEANFNVYSNNYSLCLYLAGYSSDIVNALSILPVLLPITIIITIHLIDICTTLANTLIVLFHASTKVTYTWVPYVSSYMEKAWAN